VQDGRIYCGGSDITLCKIRAEGRGTGSGYETEQEFGRELKQKRGLTAKVLHLACENRSPNRDRELSAGERNGREMEARRLT